MTANEYREYAEECMGWAKIARSDKERVSFIEMAKTWLQAAALADRSDAPSGNGATLPVGSESADLSSA
jgi:hypothetical protein